MPPECLFEKYSPFCEKGNELRNVEFHLPICLSVYLSDKRFREQDLATFLFYSQGILLAIPLFSHLFIHSEKVTSFAMKQACI